MIVLVIKPFLAHSQDLFLNIATRPNTSAIGGPNNIRDPPRIPRKVPQPKPGKPSICNKAKIHGDIASQNEVFPRFSDFIVLSHY